MSIDIIKYNVNHLWNQVAYRNLFLDLFIMGAKKSRSSSIEPDIRAISYLDAQSLTNMMNGMIALELADNNWRIRKDNGALGIVRDFCATTYGIAKDLVKGIKAEDFYLMAHEEPIEANSSRLANVAKSALLNLCGNAEFIDFGLSGSGFYMWLPKKWLIAWNFRCDTQIISDETALGETFLWLTRGIQTYKAESHYAVVCGPRFARKMLEVSNSQPALPGVEAHLMKVSSFLQIYFAMNSVETKRAEIEQHFNLIFHQAAGMLSSRQGLNEMFKVVGPIDRDA
jgi:hypothetical protein